ncbi:MAG TPA: hypothetical protein VGL23_15230 [Chloroflexota bacterium]
MATDAGRRDAMTPLAKRVVDGRREGTSMSDSVHEPEVYILPDAAGRIFDDHLVDLQAIAEV